MADGVQQVGFALTGGGLEVERRELRHLDCGHALGGIGGEHIGGAGDEAGEGERGVEADGGHADGIVRARADIGQGQADGAAFLAGGVVGGAATGIVRPVAGGFTRGIAGQTQIGHLAAAGMDGDAHVAHFAAGDFPGEAEPVGKAIRHPVGREFGGQEQIERAGILGKAAQLNRTDPLGEELLTQILLQALNDIGPIGGEIERVLIFWCAYGAGASLCGVPV